MLGPIQHMISIQYMISVLKSTTQPKSCLQPHTFIRDILSQAVTVRAALHACKPARTSFFETSYDRCCLILASVRRCAHPSSVQSVAWQRTKQLRPRIHTAIAACSVVWWILVILLRSRRDRDCRQWWLHKNTRLMDVSVRDWDDQEKLLSGPSAIIYGQLQNSLLDTWC